MSRRVLAEYRATYILRILFTAILLFFAFIISNKYITLLFALLLAFIWFYGFKTKIIIYPNRIERQSLFGKVTVPLNEQTEYFYKFVQVRVQGINTGRHTYITVKNNHQFIKADSNIKDVDDLRDQLIQIEIKNLQPQIQKALQEKSSLNFGVMKVSATGLAYKNKMLTYSEIENGFFFVKKQGERGSFFKIAVSEIPNMTTFFGLLDHYIQEKLVA